MFNARLELWKEGTISYPFFEKFWLLFHRNFKCPESRISSLVNGHEDAEKEQGGGGDSNSRQLR